MRQTALIGVKKITFTAMADEKEVS